MARELEVERDYDPIEPGCLAVTASPGEQPVTLLEMAGVVTRSPLKGQDSRREYIVEVEYRPDGLALEQEAFKEYLRTFKEAKVTQEGATRLIREDLMAALGTEEVFVEVVRSAKAEKRTRLGKL